MDVSLLILVASLLVAMVLALRKGGWPTLLLGLKQTGNTLKSTWLQILLGITLGGLIQVLVPSASIAEWLGPASGLKGILIGAYIGALIGGSPYVTFPVILGIYNAGAGVGPVIALITGQMLGVRVLIMWQIPLLGTRLALTRYLVFFLVPPLVGLAGSAVYNLLGFG